MDICVSSSRGKDLVLPNQHVVPGGRLESLVDVALSGNKRRQMGRSGGTNFIYVIGGIPDATTKIKDRNYSEVIFPDWPHPKYRRLVARFRAANERILRAGAIPVFATICTMSLQEYNSHCYEQNWTSYHIHSDHYDDMQHFLNRTLELVNNEICRINDENLVDTPHLAACVMSKRGEGQGRRVRYSRLWDGCHAGKDLVGKWQNILDEAISLNRERHTRPEMP